MAQQSPGSQTPTTKTVITPRDSRVLYMRNSIMYLEDEIYRITEEDSEDPTSYDTLIPYMVGMKPTLQFVDSNMLNTPEFYSEYPIYVDHDKYEDLQDEYYHIYKVYDGSSAVIQLIPEEYVDNRVLMSDIVKVVPYYVDSLGNEMILPFDLGITYYDGVPQKEFTTEFVFDPSTGKVTIDSVTKITFDRYLSSMQSKYQDVSGYEGEIILEFCIEKYRDITVQRDDITLEQAHQIATMQSAHQSILEYLYQFTLSEHSEQKLSETAYTIFVTTVSTIVVIIASYGINLAAGGSFSKLIASKMPGSTIPAGVSTTAASTAFGRFCQQANRVINKFKLVIAAVSESFQEVVIDPYLDALVNTALADAGYDKATQIFWSGVAESLRESFFGIVSMTVSAKISTKTQIQVSDNININTQEENRVALYVEEQQKLQDDKAVRREFYNNLAEISSIFLMLGGLGGGGLFSGAGSILGSTMLTIGVISPTLAEAVLEVKATKDWQNSKIISPNAIISDFARHVANQKLIEALEYQKKRVSTISDSRKPTPTIEAFREAAYIASSDSNKIIDWMSKHRKGLATAAVAIGVGIIGFIFPAAAPFLSAMPITIGMVAPNPNPRGFQPKYKIDLSSKYNNDQRILNHPAWRLLTYIKDNIYPSLNLGDFYANFHLSVNYALVLADNIYKSVVSGTNFYMDPITLLNFRKIISSDPHVADGHKTYVNQEVEIMLNQISQNNPRLRKLNSPEIIEFLDILYELFDTFSLYEISRKLFNGNEESLSKKLSSSSRQILSRYSIFDILFRIGRCPNLDKVKVQKANYKIQNWAYQLGIIPSPNSRLSNVLVPTPAMAGNEFYKDLADLFTEYRPDLLPNRMSYFSAEGLAKILTSSNLRYDKDFIGHAIRNDIFIQRKYLSKSYLTVTRLMTRSTARIKGQQIINKHTSLVAYLKQLGIAVSAQSRLGLYGPGFFNPNFRNAQSQRLKVEAYGLDWVTGYFTSNGMRHHIEFDKSTTDDFYLLYTDLQINVKTIPHPSVQNYFGEPVQLDALTREWVRRGRDCKEAFSRGEHNPMWLDPNSPWYHPAAARRFYWGKMMVSRHGPQWLDSSLARLDPPPWFLPHLNSNPRNIQPPP
ncbi:MAG: hypothetical protein ACFFDF_07740 [Candidatus Odinarchaeota archaeon]